MSSFRVIRFEDCRTMPWKNGGGTTTELAVFPPGSSLDTFDWRVSLALVASNGPFSLFHGCDRTLAVLQGDGLVLDLEGSTPVTLAPGDAPWPFPADRPCTGRLAGSPILDLNVMTRRGRADHVLECLDARHGASIDVGAPVTMLVAGPGGARLCLAGETVELGRWDALMARDAALTAILDGPALVYRIAIHPR